MHPLDNIFPSFLAISCHECCNYVVISDNILLTPQLSWLNISFRVPKIKWCLPQIATLCRLTWVLLQGIVLLFYSIKLSFILRYEDDYGFLNKTFDVRDSRIPPSKYSHLIFLQSVAPNYDKKFASKRNPKYQMRTWWCNSCRSKVENEKHEDYCKLYIDLAENLSKGDMVMIDNIFDDIQHVRKIWEKKVQI